MANTFFLLQQKNNKNKKKQNNFKNFLKNNSDFFLFTNIFVVFCLITITIALSTKIQQLLWKYVFSWLYEVSFVEVLKPLFQYSGFFNIFNLLSKNTLITDTVANNNYSTYIYALIFIFSIETFFLLIHFFLAKKQFNKFSLSYAWFENHKFQNFFKFLNANIANAVTYFILVLNTMIMFIYIIFQVLQKEDEIVHHFFLDFFLFIFAIFFFIGALILTNIFDWKVKYESNFKNKINLQDTKKIFLFAISQLLINFLLAAFLIFTFFIKMPWDFYLTYFLIKHISPFIKNKFFLPKEKYKFYY